MREKLKDRNRGAEREIKVIRRKESKEQRLRGSKQKPMVEKRERERAFEKERV